MNEFEIYVEDLKPETQKTLLKFLGCRTGSDGNLDVFPVAVIPKPESS
jgi:hypothetical protein